MISFLASPKPFRGIDKENQYRAVRSWLLAAPECEVILYGESAGIEEAGSELNVTVVKSVQSASSGAPFFGAIADHAAAYAKFDLQVYLNCDILLAGIAGALRSIPFPYFLLIGERIDLDQGVIIDVDRGYWKKKIGPLVKAGQIKAHGPTGIDYFAFRRGTWRNLPPVVIGRGGYDKALLVYCLKNRYPLVDGSFAVTALHQFHDYKHVAGERNEAFYGDEAKQNFKATGSMHGRALVSDAEYVLRHGRLIYWPCRGDRLRRLEVMLRFIHGWDNLGLMLRVLWRLLERLQLAGLKRIHLAELLNE